MWTEKDTGASETVIGEDMIQSVEIKEGELANMEFAMRWPMG